MTNNKQKEMYCAIIDNKTGEVCNNIDETFTAYCIKHGRSCHRIREDKKENQDETQ